VRISHVSHAVMFACYSIFIGCSVYAEDYEDLLNAVNRQFAKEVKSDYGVIFESGGGELMEDVKRVTLQFKAYHRYSINEVRPLIVNMSERYLF